MRRRLLIALCLLCLGAPASAAAQRPPIFSGFNSVLAFGEGEGTSAQDLAAYEASGAVPRTPIRPSSTRGSSRPGRG